MRTSLQQLIESRLDPEIMAVYREVEAAKKEGREPSLPFDDLFEAFRKDRKVGLLESRIAARREGKLEGERTLLKRLLTQRFGALAPAAVAHLEAATLSELEVMSLRVLTAATVEDVLGQP